MPKRRKDSPRPGARGRVALVIRLLAGRTGGAERVFCETANVLSAEGFEVAAIHCEASSAAPVYRLSPKIARLNLRTERSRRAPFYRALDTLAAGYPNKRSRAPVAWLSRNLYFMRKLHQQLRASEPDIVISFLPPANTPSLIAGLLAGIPVVPTNHSVPEHDYRSTERWDQNPVDRFLRRWALHTAERVHVLSPDYSGWFPPSIRDRVVAIPNFVDEEFITMSASATRSLRVIAVGRLVPEKNHSMLVEAWSIIAARHPLWQLEIYGEGPLRRQLDNQIQDSGCTKSVSLMGETRDIARIYRESEILCHPSLFEGFGLAVAEALATGLPVVGFFDCTGVREVVRDGENGLLADLAGGAPALASALERLIEDHALREQLRQRAPASIKLYTRDMFRARWANLVDQVVAGARRR